MDIEMQMESKGLPTQFGTTSDQPDDSHMASNVAASLTNAESSSAPQTDLKQQPPLLPTDDSVTLPRETSHSEVFPAPLQQVIPTNGISHESIVPVTNGIVSQPTSKDIDLKPIPLPLQPDFEGKTSSFDDSIMSSSAPVDLVSSMPETEPTQPTMSSITESMPVPQVPISDLRSPPHADGLTSAEVALVQAEKHKEDNAADAPPPIPIEHPIEVAPPPLAEPLVASSNLLTEPVKISDTGLATPPAQTPPPAPQLEHASLPETALNRAVTEPEHSIIPQEHDIPTILQEQDTSTIIQDQSAEPAPAPVAPASVSQVEDSEMTDAPFPVKISREREEDQEDTEPARKRMKTDEEMEKSQTPDFKVPEIPAVSSPQTNGSPAPAGSPLFDGDDSVSIPRIAHMKKIVSNLKKSNASAAFRIPVDYVLLKIPTYPQVVTKPMDLGTIDNKLKHNEYSAVSEFIQDFEQIVANCVAFNGAEHAVTQAAFKMQTSFNNQMKNLPKAAFAEPSREEKKAAKSRQEPTRQAPPRRPSISTAQSPVTGTARSPQATTPAYALNPDGVPLIRRDSNMTDGRPKRAIVPTKRNQEFAGGRPKKKKYELQLRFCQEVLKEIASSKNWQMNQYFTHPVDPVALNIPTYFQIIKKPMDFETIQTKLNNNVYDKAKDFEEDVRLVFKNCYKFNPDSDWVNTAGHQLEELFDNKWKTKDEWIAAREPVSEPQTDDEDEEDEVSEDEDDSEVERNDKIAILQKQIAEMSKQMGELTQKKPKKKSKSPSAPPKKSKSKSSKKEKPKTTFPGLQKPVEKKKSAPKPKPDRYVTFQEKQYISNGIAMLPEKQMQEALKIIQQSVPSLANSAENEIELDIEEVPNHALLRLLTFVKRYAGPPPDEPTAESIYPPGNGNKTKKGKPNKQEQEAQIEALRGQLNTYSGGPVSPNAVQSIEADNSSDDDGDSEESEEE